MIEEKKEVVVRRINPKPVDLWHIEKGFIDQVNDFELLDVMFQIKEKQLSGYYVMFVSEDGNRIDKIQIDRNGRLEDYPKGFCDTMLNLQLKLI